MFVNDEEKQEYFVGIEKKKSSVMLDKPIYTEFTVLELSKLHMYNFHYNHMMRKYGPEKAKLLFTDTDSLTYQVTTPDLYQDMLEDQDLFDTSNYPREHPLYSVVNKKKIGKFKDETGGLPIIEFIGLRPKMYSFKTEDRKEKKTGKGIKKSVLKKEVRHQDFKDCLFKCKEYQNAMMGFRSQRHGLFTIKQTKKSLSPFDDKRSIREDGYTTRAHGHWRNGVARLQMEKVTTPELIESMEALSLCNESITTHSIDTQEPSTSTDLSEPNADVQEPVDTTDLPDIALPKPYSVTTLFSK